MKEDGTGRACPAGETSPSPGPCAVSSLVLLLYKGAGGIRTARRRHRLVRNFRLQIYTQPGRLEHDDTNAGHETGNRKQEHMTSVPALALLKGASD